MMRSLLFVLLLLSFEAGAADTWYVDQSGTGAGTADGTSYSNRFAGWTDAWANAADIDAGDTVYACGTLTTSVAFGDGGSAGNPLTIDGACPKGDGTFDYGSVSVTGTTCFTSLTTRAYVVFQNMAFAGYTGNCLDMRSQTGAQVLNSSFTGTNGGVDTALIIGNASAIVRNVTVTNSSQGISTRGCTNCLFQNITITDGGMYGTGSAANLDGLTIDDSGGVGCEGTIVEDVVVLRQGSSQGSGIDFQCAAGTGTIIGRRMFLAYSEGVGFTVGSTSTQNHDISASIATQNAGGGWYLKSSNTPATFSNIVGMQAPGNGFAAFRFGDGSTTGLTATIKNSVFAGDRAFGYTVGSGTLTDSHNAYVGAINNSSTGDRTLAQWITDGQCAAGGCVSSNPAFLGGVSPTTAEGFKLRSNSPLIRAGTCYLTTGCVHRDFGGRRARVPPDIGAWQRVPGD